MTIIVHHGPPPAKVRDLLERGTVVERDALDYLAAQGFQAAIDAREELRKHSHDGIEGLVVMDPDEEALVLVWRQK